MTITPHNCCINSTCPKTPHLPTGARRQGRDKENSHTKSQGESPESPVLLGPQGWGLVVSVCTVFESLSASVLLKKKKKIYDKNPPSQKKKKKIAAKRNEEKLKKKRGGKKNHTKIFHHMHPLSQQDFLFAKSYFCGDGPCFLWQGPF